MQKQIRSISVHIVCAMVIAIFGVTGCANLKNRNLAGANTVLTKVGKFAEDSFYSCLLNGYTQGLSPAQARDECATQLLADDQKGFGGSIGDIQAGKASFFDPSKITAACNSGDPTRGQTSGNNTRPGWGNNTWGEKSDQSKGLSKEESNRQKDEAIAHAENETTKFNNLEQKEIEKTEALKEAKKSGDPAKIETAKVEQEAANKAAVEQAGKALEAIEKAREDPNQKPMPVGRPVAGESPCEQALQSARELLRECHRTQWKDFRCQQLQASMSGCPDPTLILVDPDQGYSCGAKVDPEAVKNAWVAKCEKRVKFGPDGPNPCEPPMIDRAGRFGQGKMGDICGNPYAQTDPNQDECSTVTIGKQFGEIDIQELIVVFLNKFGGPIVVIPTNPNPPPRPGPDPRPVPH